MTEQQERLLKIVEEAVTNFNNKASDILTKAGKSKAISNAYKKDIQDMSRASASVLNHLWELRKELTD